MSYKIVRALEYDSHVTDAINITLGEQHWGQTSRGSGTVNKRLTNCEQIFEKKIEWRRMKTVEK